MAISGTQILIIGILLAASFIVYFVKRSSGPSFLVRRWADDNGFRILAAKFRYFSKGPFTWKLSHRGQEVYHVRVRDTEGRERSGWLRCTDVSLFSGDKTEVIWEDEV
jgi:hypothetical protein